MFVSRIMLIQGCLVAGICAQAIGATAQESRKRAAGPADGVSLCVQMREQIFECKEVFADAFVEMRRPPADQKVALKKQVLEEITSDGSGPLPPRRQRCEAMGRSISGSALAPMQKQLDACGAMKDCRQRLTCIRDLMGGPKAAPSKPVEPQSKPVK
jgi:hypothetical protein